MAAIQTRGLSKRYGDVVALDGLSLSVDHGECYGFLGPNGAGKSTTINVLTGQLRPDEGTARVAGVDPVVTPVEARRHVGVLPENGRPPSFLTVREYFEFAAATRGLDAETLASRLDRWAERLAFAEKLDTLCADLSQGERQKVLVAQAFVHEPPVVFIDEPLTNLDPIVQERVKRFFETYRRAGNTLFLSTHFVGTAAEVCTEVGIVNRGRLLTELRPRGMDGDALLDRFFEIVDDDVTVDEDDLAVRDDDAATPVGDPTTPADDPATPAGDSATPVGDPATSAGDPTMPPGDREDGRADGADPFETTPGTGTSSSTDP